MKSLFLRLKASVTLRGGTPWGIEENGSESRKIKGESDLHWIKDKTLTSGPIKKMHRGEVSLIHATSQHHLSWRPNHISSNYESKKIIDEIEVIEHFYDLQTGLIFPTYFWGITCGTFLRGKLTASSWWFLLALASIFWSRPQWLSHN